MQLAAAVGAALLIVGPAYGRTDTTNQPAIFTVRVTITDHGITMTPNHAARGSTVTFILTNRGKKIHKFQIGDVKRGPGYGQGFAQTLKPDQQYTKIMYLDYRGIMNFKTKVGSTLVATGKFKIT